MKHSIPARRIKLHILMLIIMLTISLSNSYAVSQSFSNINDTLTLYDEGGKITALVITGKEDIKIAETIMRELLPLKESSTTQRLMIAAAKKLLDTPYVAGTLDEGDKEYLRIYLTKTDCILFVETCLNLALTIKTYGEKADFQKFANLIRLSRYRKGCVVNYSDRVHYTTEWIRSLEKRGLAKDITIECGGVRLYHPINYMSSHPQNYKQLSRNCVAVGQIKEIEAGLNSKPFYYIPTRSITDMEDKISSGNIIAYRSAVSGLDIAHVALALVEDGEVKFIHASMAEKKVVIDKKPIAEYVKGRKNLTGLSIVEVK